jgi:hypothetical protein
MYTFPVRAGPAASSLVDLEVWWKEGDHYTVGSDAGKAEAAAKGYIRVGSLG